MIVKRQRRTWLFLAALSGALGVIGWRHHAALRELEVELGAQGNVGTYFNEKIRNGMTYRQTLAALAAKPYPRVEYFTCGGKVVVLWSFSVSPMSFPGRVTSRSTLCSTIRQRLLTLRCWTSTFAD